MLAVSLPKACLSRAPPQKLERTKGGGPWARDCHPQEKLRAVHHTRVAMSVRPGQTCAESSTLLTTQKTISEIQGADGDGEVEGRGRRMRLRVRGLVRGQG